MTRSVSGSGCPGSGLGEAGEATGGELGRGGQQGDLGEMDEPDTSASKAEGARQGIFQVFGLEPEPPPARICTPETFPVPAPTEVRSRHTRTHNHVL